MASAVLFLKGGVGVDIWERQVWNAKMSLDNLWKENTLAKEEHLEQSQGGEELGLFENQQGGRDDAANIGDVGRWGVRSKRDQSKKRRLTSL